MATPSIPSNYYISQANRQVALSWGITAGATGYSVQRSTDGVTFTTIATPVVNNYLDTTPSTGVLYYYQVASTNLSGTSPYTAPLSIIPTPTGEMSLAELRLLSQQRADLVGSNFVTTPEWNSYINQSMFELYDILITAYEDYYMAQPAQFPIVQSAQLYPLPDGITTFLNGNGGTFVPAPFYKLRGVDLALNTASNAWVTVQKFMFEERNRYIYPNTASTIYGAYNLQYRMIGNNIEFIPPPSAGQNVRIWYIPRLQELLLDTDLTATGISGWCEYIIVDAAIKAMQKQELDSSVLQAQKVALTIRIQSASQNRDANQPDRITDVRSTWNNSFSGSGFNSPTGGW